MGIFRTLRAITYKKILNKSNAILAACLHLLATFGLECRAFACKKRYHLQYHFLKWEEAPILPLPVRRLCLGDLSVETVLVGSTVYETHFTNIKITSNCLPFFKIQTATVFFSRKQVICKQGSDVSPVCTGGIVQRLDTDLHSAVTAMVRIVMLQRWQWQRWDISGYDSDVTATFTLVWHRWQLTLLWQRWQPSVLCQRWHMAPLW